MRSHLKKLRETDDSNAGGRKNYGTKTINKILAG